MKSSILIVDDNADLLDLMQTILSTKGFDVATAQSGAEGLRALETEVTPDLVLLDVQIGDMTGPQFMDRLEETNSKALEETSFVYCTAGADPEDERVDGCLNKMCDLSEFVSRIHAVIAGPGLAFEGFSK